MVQITPLVSQVFKALGLMVNMVKSQLILQQELESLGFLNLPTSGFPERENEENTTEFPNPSAATAGLDKRHSQVRGESLSFSESNLAGSPPLQSLTVHDELGSSIRSSPHDEDDQVQRQTESY